MRVEQIYDVEQKIYYRVIKWTNEGLVCCKDEKGVKRKPLIFISYTYLHTFEVVR